MGPVAWERDPPGGGPFGRHAPGAARVLRVPGRGVGGVRPRGDATIPSARGPRRFPSCILAKTDCGVARYSGRRSHIGLCQTCVCEASAFQGGRDGARPSRGGPGRTPRAGGGAGTSRAGPWRWGRSVARERDPPGGGRWEGDAGRGKRWKKKFSKNPKLPLDRGGGGEYCKICAFFARTRNSRFHGAVLGRTTARRLGLVPKAFRPLFRAGAGRSPVARKLVKTKQKGLHDDKVHPLQEK